MIGAKFKYILTFVSTCAHIFPTIIDNENVLKIKIEYKKFRNHAFENDMFRTKYYECRHSDPFSKNAILIFLITVVEQHI